MADHLVRAARPGQTATETESVPMLPADKRLIEGLTVGSTSAIREFALRFLPALMEKARCLRVPPSERETVVQSFLDDMLTRIADGARPRALDAYMMRSFRNEILLARRRIAEQAAHRAERAIEVGDVMVIRETCSAYAIRSAFGVNETAEHQDPVLAAFMEYLFQYVSETDRMLLTWRAHRIPTRETAEWLGIGHGAARVRISRICARLLDQALQYRQTLPDDQRAVLDRFLRRAGVLETEPQVPHLCISRPPGVNQ